MRDAMPLPSIAGLLSGHIGTAWSLGTSPEPLSLDRLVITLAGADPDESTTVELRDGATTLITAIVPAAANEVEVVPATKVITYAGTALALVVTAAGNESSGLAGLLETIPYG